MWTIILKLGGKALPFLLPVLGFIPALAGNLFKKEFWAKYGKFVLVIALGIVVYVLYNRWQNGRTLEEVAGDDSSSRRAYATAEILADYLGTNKELKWYQPSGWYEDETKATELLVQNKSILKLIELKYADISESGNLRRDIEKLYKAKQKTELFKKLGWL